MSIDTDKGGGEIHKNRTWRLEIEAPVGKDRILRAYRENVRVNNIDEVVITDDVPQQGRAGVVERILTGSILDETITIDSVDHTVAQVIDGLINKLDAWRVEDLKCLK